MHPSFVYRSGERGTGMVRPPVYPQTIMPEKTAWHFSRNHENGIYLRKQSFSIPVFFFLKGTISVCRHSCPDA